MQDSLWVMLGRTAPLWLPFQCPVLSLQDVVKGLFVCCLFLECVALSRRFVPEVINFLLGILYIATPNKQSQGELVCGNFLDVCRTWEFLKSDSPETKTKHLCSPVAQSSMCPLHAHVRAHTCLLQGKRLSRPQVTCGKSEQTVSSTPCSQDAVSRNTHEDLTHAHLRL